MKRFEPFEQHFIETTNGIKLYAVSNFSVKNFNPNRPVILFNYGLVCNMAHFDYQVQEFSKRNIQFILHDYRGHYRSTGTDIKNINFNTISTDIKVILDYFNIHKVTLIGHSMGVNICLEFSKRYQEIVNGMILIAGAISPPQSHMFNSHIMQFITPYLENFEQKYPELVKKIWRLNHLNPLIRKVVKLGGFNVQQVPDEFIKHYLKKIGELPPKLFFKLFTEMQEHDIANFLPNIKTKSLVIAGDADQVLPHYLHCYMAKQLPQGRLFTIHQGSHVPQVDFPELTNDAIIEFIEEIWIL